MSAPSQTKASVHPREPGDKATSAGGDDYKPTMDRFARAMIARIQRDPNDIEAIRALEGHYQESGDQPSLVNLMEGWGDTLHGKDAADAYLRAADAALVGLGDRTRAKTLYERALSRDAGSSEALDRVLRLLEDASDFERQKQVLKFVTYRLEQTQNVDPQQLAAAHYRLGQVYELRFDQSGKAVNCYRKAIEANPKLISAITAARRLYAEVGNLQAIAALYEFEIDASPNNDDKRALLLALSVTRREQHDLDGAVSALRRVLKLYPGDTGALRELGEVLVARANNTPDSDTSAADQLRAAEVFYQLGRSVPRSEARDFVARAVELHPQHEKASNLLRELSGHGRDSDAPLDAPASQASATPQLMLDARATQRLDPAVQAAIAALAANAELPAPSNSEANASPEAANPTPMDMLAPSAHFDAAASAYPVVSAVVVPPTAAVPDIEERDEAEEWLNDGDIEVLSALGTSELMPLLIDEAEPTHGAALRPSSLPPDVFSEAAAQASFPLAEQLRAPRMPDLNAARASVAPAHPSGRPRSLPPPPPPMAANVNERASLAPETAARASAAHDDAEYGRGRLSPPPAYDEIPGATPASDAPGSFARRSRTDSTLVGWGTADEPSEPSQPHVTAPRPQPVASQAQHASVAGEDVPHPSAAMSAPAPVLTPAPRARPKSDAPDPVRAEVSAMSRSMSRISVSSEAPSAAPAAVEPGPIAHKRLPAVPKKLRAAQDERVSALLRSAREEAAARRQPYASNDADHAPESAAPVLGSTLIGYTHTPGYAQQANDQHAYDQQIHDQDAYALASAQAAYATEPIYAEPVAEPTWAPAPAAPAYEPPPMAASVPTAPSYAHDPELPQPLMPELQRFPSSAPPRMQSSAPAVRRSAPPPAPAPRRKSGLVARTPFPPAAASVLPPAPIPPAALPEHAAWERAAEAPAWNPPPMAAAPATPMYEPPPAAPVYEPPPNEGPRAQVISGELPFDPGSDELEVNVGATTESNFYVGFSNRLADGGVFVATYNPLPANSEVAMLITLPGNFQARAIGRVRLIRDSLDPFSDDVPGMCVAFEAIGEGSLGLIERFAQKRTPVFIED